MTVYAKGFDFAEFEQKVGVPEDDAERRIMGIFKRYEYILIPALRESYYLMNGQVDEADLENKERQEDLIDVLYCCFMDWLDEKERNRWRIEEEVRGQTFNCEHVAFLRKALLTLIAMGFIRTDLLPNGLLNEVKAIFDLKELFGYENYDSWICNTRKTMAEIKTYICELLPPGQGEIYLYDRTYSFYKQYTGQQQELLSAARENMRIRSGDILRFISI